MDDNESLIAEALSGWSGFSVRSNLRGGLQSPCHIRLFPLLYIAFQPHFVFFSLIISYLPSEAMLATLPPMHISPLEPPPQTEMVSNLSKDVTVT